MSSYAKYKNLGTKENFTDSNGESEIKKVKSAHCTKKVCFWPKKFFYGPFKMSNFALNNCTVAHFHMYIIQHEKSKK